MELTYLSKASRTYKLMDQISPEIKEQYDIALENAKVRHGLKDFKPSWNHDKIETVSDAEFATLSAIHLLRNLDIPVPDAEHSFN